MNIENNYPIVYAVMELLDGKGDKVVYVPSKAYLVGDNIVYYFNGKSKRSYNVVFPFPYRYIKEIRKDNRDYPMFKSGTDVPWNAKAVDSIFNNFGETKVKADELNKQLLRDHLSVYPASQVEQALEDYYKYLPYDRGIEELIQELTMDMVVTQIEEKRKVKTIGNI